MGLLSGGTTLPLNKCTVSLWFRIPTETADAAIAEANGGTYTWDVMTGHVPLVVFGGQTVATIGGDSIPLPPTYIGVQFFPFGAGSAIVVNIATNDFASWSDPSFAYGGPEYLGNVNQGLVGGPTVDAGKWHHLLLSWDLAAGNSSSMVTVATVLTSTYTATSKMWFALDDVNYDGVNLPANTVFAAMGGTGDPNEILSVSPAVYLHQGTLDGGGNNTETVDVSFSSLSASSIAIPAPATLDRQGAGVIDTFFPVKKVAMAELQIFSDVALDTSVEANRRLFVNALGRPVLTLPGPSSAMGKNPDVALAHSSGNWISGTNSGGVTTTLSKTGTIIPFTPDPQIGA